jgi:hypothetical protein
LDDIVLRAMLKWPDTPDVYGWLRLDRRGRWRIRTETASGPMFEPIANAALNAFIGRNYAVDARGCWYFQNGPQRVFVALEYTPFVFSLGAQGLADQRGMPAGRVDAAWLDEEGTLVLEAGPVVGVLDDRDLGAFADALAEGYFPIPEGRLQVGSVPRIELQGRFGFRPDPAA